MNIIKAGIPQPDPVSAIHTGDCATCGCQVEVPFKELEVYTPEPHSDADGFFYVVCPTKNCGAWIVTHKKT